MWRRVRLSVLAVIGGLMSMGMYVQSPTTLSVPQNIWLCDTLLLISDRDNGLMVFSMADPSSGRHITNIPVNRNSGLAASGTTIFANSADSIVAYGLEPDGKVKRLGGIRLYSYYPDYYIAREPSPLFTCVPPISAQRLAAPLLPFLACSEQPSGGGGRDAGTVNTGGSMAVFAVMDSFLYYVDESNLYTVSISNPSRMVQLSQQSVGWDVETIFPTSRYLFIGGREGMYIYDRSQPSEPVYAGMVSHFRSCDPVVVRGAAAFVTLRSGSSCGGSRDVLMSVDVSDPENTRILKEIDATTPYGLAVGDSLLYVANGWAGFSLYRAANPLDLEIIAQWSEPAARDFIWDRDRLYLMGMEEVVVYDVADPFNPRELGSIE
ncbi:MAG: hypothetical protein JXA18_15800 [Chitinispirillaceae bacterium]|nr:hypothetical protein [Chitinispirillaceae bacterium]